jgi:hypothetical protein
MGLVEADYSTVGVSFTGMATLYDVPSDECERKASLVFDDMDIKGSKKRLVATEEQVSFNAIWRLYG